MRVLWLCGECPEPATSGLTAYSRGLVRAVGDAGAEVRCLGLGVGQERAAVPGVTWEVVQGRRRPQQRSVVSRLPAMAHGFAVPGYQRALRSALNEQWDAIVIDHLEMGWALPLVRARGGGARLVHVSHNHESAVRAAVARAEPRPARRAALALDAWKVARLERAVVRAADLVTAITDEDGGGLAAIGARRVATLPPGYDGPCVDRTISDALPRRAVLLGTFEWHVKDANLARFLAIADPVFAEAGAELRVVGPVGQQSRALAGALRATTFAGRVPSVAEELAAARLGIVAEPVGGGFKMKALDFVFCGVPMAVLAGSVNGLPLRSGESAIVCPDEAALAAAAVRVLDDVPLLDRLQRAARHACEGRFDWAERGRRLLAEIEAVNAPRRTR